MKTHAVKSMPVQGSSSGAHGIDAGGGVSWGVLFFAIAIVLGLTIYPRALISAAGTVDHTAVMILMWAMAAGFVRGVGFIPRTRILRWVFSGWACFFAMGLVAARLLLLG